MPKNNNVVDSTSIRITVSVQSGQLLEKLAARGIYGRNPAEVAGRFIDKALAEFVEKPNLKLDIKKSTRKR